MCSDRLVGWPDVMEFALQGRYVDYVAQEGAKNWKSKASVGMSLFF